MRNPRSLIVSLLAITAATTAGPGGAAAQQAPIGQAHGGRGGASSSPIAGAAEVVDIDHPPERHGLPVPLSLVHAGGGQVLEAGVGWSVPLSYVMQNDGLSRQRPRFLQSFAAATPPLQRKTTLVLGGRTIALIASDTTGHYRAIVDEQQVQATAIDAATWEVTDGTGLIYRFEALAALGNPTIAYLTSIRSGHFDQSRVVLGYRVVSRTLGGGLTAPELFLDTIRYDHDATGGCAKHELALSYVDDPTQPPPPPNSAPAPLAIAVDNGRIRVRTQVLAAIDVRARGNTCVTTPQRIARYQLGYAADADTGAPRLARVDRYGRDGTPEAAIAQPVARYGYGTASRTPVASEPPRLAYTQGPSIIADKLGTVADGATTATLQDFDGDGLPDLLTRTTVRKNVRGQSFASPTALYPPSMTSHPSQLGDTWTWNQHHYYPGGYRETAHESTMIQLMDFNGDGRTDIVDANVGDRTWRIYLNRTTGWAIADVDVGGLLDELSAQYQLELGDRLPIARSSTGRSFSEDYCYHWVGAGTLDPGDDGWADCIGVAPSVHLDAQITRYDWKLADINGDGYPDLVADSAPSFNVVPDDEGLESGPPASCPPVAAPSPGAPDRHCGPDQAFRFMRRGVDGTWSQTGNQLWVWTNQAGAWALGGTPLFSRHTVLAASSSCGVEQWVATPVDVARADGDVVDGLVTWGAVGMAGSRQICGFVDVNGDGLLDRIEPATVALGTGTGYAGNFADRYPTTIAAVTTDRYPVCDAPDQVPAGAEYTTTLTTGYFDLNGDGLVDYLDGRTVRLGTGAGLAVAIGLRAPVDFAASRAVTNCAATDTRTTAGLYDLDGDGHLDFVELTEGSDRVFDVWSLYDDATGPGALDAGRLVDVRNGYGAVTRFVYQSAKQDAFTSHAVPFPEIVVGRTTTDVDAGPGTGLATTRAAYGGASLWFDAIADRWTFRGYARTVSLRGEATSVPGVTKGRAVIANALQPGDLATNHDRILQVGRPRQVVTLEGNLLADPWQYLDPSRDLAHEGAWAGQADLTYGSRSSPLAGFNAGDECTDVPQPVAPYGEPLGLGLSDGDLDPPCRQVSVVYARTIDRHRGTSLLPGSTAHIDTRVTNQTVDDLGRATAVLEQHDLSRADDDVCVMTTYAASIDGWRVLDAPSKIQRYEPRSTGEFSPPTCAGVTKIVAGDHFTYDGLPEGQVGRGLLSSHAVERRDPGGGALFEQWTERSLARDGWGNLSYAIADAGGGKTLRTTFDQFDGFGLVADRITRAASDVVAPLVMQQVHDPVTLDVTQITDPNGLRATTAIDGFGRTIRTTYRDPADGIEYAAKVVDYAGQTVVGAAGDTLDPGGLRIRIRSFADRVPIASVDPAATTPSPLETWSTTRFDALGRVRWRERTLGTDYGGQSLISDETTYDSLSRPWFVAAAYRQGAAGPRYGTSYHYRADDGVQCAVVGRGRQETLTSAPSSARYATCSDVTYSQSQRHVTVRGASENDPAAPAYNAYDEAVADATGRIRSRLRRRASTIYDQVDLGYDRLGQPNLVRRYKTPGGAGSLSTWSATIDSLGRTIAVAEPGTAQRDTTYDHAGNPIEVAWMDGTVRRSIRTDFDGLGRRLRSSTLAGTVEDLPSVDTYFYDEGSGEPFHQDVGYLRGRLSHAHSATQDVFYGYDSLGHPSFEAVVDSSDRRVERRFSHRADGEVASASFALPDNGYALERATYQYDSAQRLIGVRWQDETTPTPAPVFTATAIDPFGRYRAVRYGNGVTESFDYRDADRDELLGRTLTASNGGWGATFAYDTDLRVNYRLDASSLTPAGRYEESRYTYDAADRLATARVQNLSAATYAVDETYSYDGLGNLTALDDAAGNLDFTIATDTVDPDRLCRVTGATFPTGTGCSYGYDALGNVASSPLGLLYGRRLTYDGRARVKKLERMSGKIASGPAATYAYDPFGGISELTVTGAGVTDERHDVRYGDAIELSWAKDGSVVSTLFERRIPGPFGTLFVKRGSGAGQRRLYLHGDGGGARKISTAAGAVTQEIEVRPFGEERLNTGARGTSTFWEHGFNGGDLLPDLQVEQIGARMYEPRVGRFLERDPLGVVRGAGQTSPYGFAWNDPIGRGDPTGLDVEGIGTGAAGLGVGILLGSVITNYMVHQFATGGASAGPQRPPPTPPHLFRFPAATQLVDADEAGRSWGDEVLPPAPPAPPAAVVAAAPDIDSPIGTVEWTYGDTSTKVRGSEGRSGWTGSWRQGISMASLHDSDHQTHSFGNFKIDASQNSKVGFSAYDWKTSIDLGHGTTLEGGASLFDYSVDTKGQQKLELASAKFGMSYDLGVVDLKALAGAGISYDKDGFHAGKKVEIGVRVKTGHSIVNRVVDGLLNGDLYSDLLSDTVGGAYDFIKDMPNKRVEKEIKRWDLRTSKAWGQL